MKRLILVALLFTSATAQSLPSYESLSSAKGRTQLYLIADTTARKQILSVLAKAKEFTIVDPDLANVFMEYRTLSRGQTPTLGIATETGQMDVYIVRGTKKVIVWTKDDYDHFKDSAPKSLIKAFLKDWYKLAK